MGDMQMGAAAAYAARRVVASLRQAEASSGRYAVGTLLLAQDPSDLNRSCSHPRRPSCWPGSCRLRVLFMECRGPRPCYIWLSPVPCCAWSAGAAMPGRSPQARCCLRVVMKPVFFRVVDACCAHHL